MRRGMIGGLVALALAACNDNSGPGQGVSDAQLHIVVQSPLARPLFATRDSFWAKVADGREMRLSYQGATAADTGEEFLRFEVPGDGLYRKPDGSAFLPGDSILITIAVVDPTRFLFDFEPAGLQLSPEHPARLKVHYLRSDHDFDKDGKEDASDAQIETRLDLWWRVGPGAPWFPIGAVKFEQLEELDANIRSFSQYAVAW